jgi:hypothetical protein
MVSEISIPTIPWRLRQVQRVAPLGARLLPRLPERLSQLAVGRVLGRWPALSGVSDDGIYVRSARQTFQLAFPTEDADRFGDRWLAARSQGLAISLNYMARWAAGRESRLVRPRPSFRLRGTGPFIVVYLHYSLEPIVQLACLAAHSALSFRWPVYPLEPGLEDERALWLSHTRLPPTLARTFVSVADPKWVVDTLGHLRNGGSVLMALDGPLDARHPAGTTFAIGDLRVPVAPTVERFAQVEEAQLVFAWPIRESDCIWTLDLVGVAGVQELAALAAAWISTHIEHWAGWPYGVWREDSVEMRQTITISTVRQRAS